MSNNEGQRWRSWISPGLGGGEDIGKDTYARKRNVKKNRSSKECSHQ